METYWNNKFGNLWSFMDLEGGGAARVDKISRYEYFFVENTEY